MALKMMASQLRRTKPALRAPAKLVDPFYRTPEWRALAADVKELRGFVCEGCGGDFSKRRDKLIADHKIERKDGGADLDPVNIQCLCIYCHNRKTGLARKQRMAQSSE